MINIMQCFNILTVSGLFIILLSACGKDERLTQLKQQVTHIREITAAHALPATRPLALPAIRYQSEISHSSETGTIQQNKAHLLTNYPISSLQFLGIIEQDNETWAYVMTPDNITYQVKESDMLGTQKGRIVKITDDHIDVLEPTPATASKPSTARIVTLKLKG